MKQFFPVLFALFIALVQVSEAGAAAQRTVGQMARDTRAERLRAYLNAQGSPLAGESAHFVAEADRLGLDWKLVAAIAGAESTFGKYVPGGSYNAWGWGIPTGAKSGIVFRSWKEGITAVSEGLATGYIARGAKTVEQIGRTYAASPRWAGSVRFFMGRIEAFTPTRPSLLALSL